MPNKYWFKPKRYGWGMTPSSWEGWTVTAILILIVLWRATLLENDELSVRFFVELILIVIIFIFLARHKTEGKMKWRWGKC